ncbi:hypothetical protein [Rugamonas apoptosis]|nr:hypothetical protein [Rugamonas apoptosis]
MARPRHGHTDEVVAMVPDRSSPEAGFVTNANLLIDGGCAA